MQATTPTSVNYVPAWLVVTSALWSLLIRISPQQRRRESHGTGSPRPKAVYNSVLKLGTIEARRGVLAV